MTYLIIGSVVLLAVGLWFRWAKKVDRQIGKNSVVELARARAAQRDSSRAFRDTDLHFTSPAVPDIHELTASETVVVDLLLRDIQEPAVVRAEANVYEIDMDKELKK